MKLKYFQEVASTDIKSIRTKLDENFLMFRNFQYELDHHRVLIMRKADSDNVMRIENLFNDYTPIYEFNLVLDKIPSFAKVAEVHKIRKDLEVIENAVKLMAQQDEVLRKIEELRDSIHVRISTFVETPTFESSIHNINDLIKKLMMKLNKEDEKIVTTQRKINEAFRGIEVKLNKMEFEEEIK